MGRRALTAQEKAERQRQRQEALHAKQTLRLVREHALDPHLRVIVDGALLISSASQTIAATIDRPYANEYHSPVDPPARERHAASTPSELPSCPGPSTVQRDEGSHSSPLIAKLSALDIRGDASTRPNAATHGPTDLRPVPVLPPILQNDEHNHSHYDAQNSPFDGDTEVSISEDCSAAKSANPVLSSSSPMHPYEYPVSELVSPSSQRPNARTWFTSSSAPSATEPHDPVLDGFLRPIDWQETSESADFLCIQSGVYEKVFRSFFARECECPRSCKIAEPEHAHTLQERTEYIQRSLPPLHSVFNDLGAQTRNTHGSFSRWDSFLSDQPSEPLSFRKTQASLTPESVTITRQWDVDSIWFGAKMIQPHGLDLAHTRHTSIGTFTTAGVRFSVLLFFPNGARSHTKASANSLSLARCKDLYDEIILPAIFETVPDYVQQEIPSSYDLLYAKSRAYQEKPGAGRWSAEDESRAFRLSYSIPASNLADFWASVVEKANVHRVQTRRGGTVPYFGNPRLLFQAHDLKNTFASQTLRGSLVLFRDIVLAGLDANQIDMHSCWLDVGMRDHVRQPSSPSLIHHGGEPWTLLCKSACCEHLHGQLGGIVPEASLVADQYRSYLLRDVGTYYAKAKPSQSSNPGHPEARSPGIIRAKAYNCSKDLFGVMFSDYQLFSPGLLPLLAFDEAMLKDLAATDQNRQRAFVSQLNRSCLVDAWEANKRHMRAIATLKRYPNFGIRKEVTLRLDVILTMWADGMLDPDQNPHTGPVCWDVPFNSAASEQEYRFDNWIWRPTWTVLTRGRGQRSIKQRRGLGLGDIIDNSGTFWIPAGHFDWQRGHIALEVLVDLYISRNPLQAKLARQSNVQALTASQITIELRFQQLISNARTEYDQGHKEDALKLVDRAITLAVQEIARSYHQHFLAKLHSYWDRTRGQVGRQKLPVLDLLKQAQEGSAAETGRIPTAQTVHGIYAEAWAKYCQAMADDVDGGGHSDIDISSTSSLQSALPEELPCWMATRRRLPPKNSWSGFIFQQIFCRPKPPTWNALFFLQLYRRFKEVWEKASRKWAPVTGRAIWYHNKPPFFQIQYWAPYFSPPRGEENTPLSSVYHRLEYPEGLSSCSTPFVPSSREFDNGDAFRIPVAETHISARIFEEIVDQPTILLPTRDNFIGLLDAIKVFPGHSSSFLARLSWTRRRLNNQGDQYDVCSRLGARQEELEPTAEDQSLLDQFLRQREPPEWDVESINTPYSAVVEDEDEMEASMEENGFSSDELESTR
ncbi:hypothetical protein F53441_12718 [Fusarium austroafricanum]|uniref:Uncharacterized protein n=1 Tax=Fusarium austroafricanum TaxID=2364996 RepID=A0A8H4JVK7_9HYPO|nr:hypothetical protein F53441_12718 [Fusarium austroafricanum]